MEKRVVINGEVYRLKFFINGWEEGMDYFQSVGRFGEASMEKLASGETIKKDGNTFSIRYVDEYGHEYTVQEILGGEVE